MVIGWRFLEIGKIEGCKGHPPGMYYSLTSAHYCEECGRFVGRWLSCSCVKVWCKDCIEKIEKRREGDKENVL